MSVLQTRGGIPRVFRATVNNTTGIAHRPGFVCLYLIIRVAANPCKMYFTEDDFDNDVNFITVPVPAAGTPYGEWRGQIEAKQVWLLGDGGNTTVELVTFQRRG